MAALDRDPAGAAAAWWVEAKQAGAVIRQPRKDGSDIQAAARQLGVTLTEHNVVAHRRRLHGSKPCFNRRSAAAI
jgi:hypothetical protein